jgi:murein DD-endopeptidase MepM/ murein hydrolase activator NlpD
MEFKRSDINYNRKQNNGFVLLIFIKDLGVYLLYRLKQIVLIILGLVKFLIDSFSGLKDFIVHRMFWGRGSLYRTAFHFVIFSLTVVILASGISTKLNIFAAESNGLGLSGSIVGRKDIIFQSGTAESLSVINSDEADFEIYKYIVQKDDTLSSIAKLYSKNVTTLVWANGLASKDVVLKIGQVLRIPPIDGAYYTIKSGDTLEKIAKTTNSSVGEIIDLNGIDRENPVIAVGKEIFLPNGVIPTPVPVKKPSTNYSSGGGNIINIPNGSLINPLKGCGGYSVTSGYGNRLLCYNGSCKWSFHHGVDMAKNGGCWIESSGNGIVTTASWGGWGFTVIIDHGNGIKTIYGHGNGNFAVKKGDTVKAGQRIMYMGRSGIATGVHLHFQIDINGSSVNPTKYVRL